MYRIFFSDKLNLAVAIHSGPFIGAEAIVAGKEILADARYTDMHILLWDLRRVTSMTLADTDRAFVLQSKKHLKPFLKARHVLLFQTGNPINEIHNQRSERLRRFSPLPFQMKTCSLTQAADWLGVDEQGLNSFLEKSLDTQK
ncbi:MAG: hypothetical protein P8N51_16220 [Pseudomonadales bacterium]|nr:hypothetical protein [Pseudomonadales bacterium]MDG1443420.1 hypothetical protein [Pseudomonadales bacterium]